MLQYIGVFYTRQCGHIVYIQGRHGGAVVKTVTSSQESHKCDTVSRFYSLFLQDRNIHMSADAGETRKEKQWIIMIRFCYFF